MVKFQCKRSGNFVSFTNEDDIAGLRIHEGYTEVKEDPIVIEVKEVTIPEFIKEKKRGRPAKH